METAEDRARESAELAAMRLAKLPATSEGIARHITELEARLAALRKDYADLQRLEQEFRY